MLLVVARKRRKTRGVDGANRQRPLTIRTRYRTTRKLLINRKYKCDTKVKILRLILFSDYNFDVP